LFRAKSIERFSVVLAFLQNGVPTQPRLRAFQNQKLEEHSIVVYRNAPFLIMISNGRFSRSPGTTRHNLEATSCASCSHGPVRRSGAANFPTSIRSELWLLRRNFVV